MASVALIGPDGAGKTTLTRMLEQSDVLPFRYLYMGIDIPASNLALPTSRLIERLKQRGPAAGGGTAATSRPARKGLLRRLGRRVWSLARLCNRLAEQWFRQFVSWYYQARGYVVLYDRHFVFDFSPEITGEALSLDKRLHQWYLWHIYPRPDLVIFLDAPGALLYARKGEQTPEELERRRQAFLATGRRLRNFVRVDATRPLPEVFAEVTDHVVRFCQRPVRQPAEARDMR
jgi:thymidylate kinase